MQKLLIDLKFCITISLLLLALTGFGQSSALKNVLEQYRNNDLDSAKQLIDIAISNPDLGKRTVSWYLKGFVYKDIYKRMGRKDSSEYFRREAIEAFEKVLEMDKTGSYQAESEQSMRFLATAYFNESIRQIKERSFDTAEAYYGSFDKYMGLVSNDSLPSPKNEINFYLALGSGYVGLDKDDTTTDYSGKAVFAFDEVLKRDSTNKEANYNLGVIYYNKAVNLILELDYDEVNIVDLGTFEDDALRLFEKSLPYMIAAHKVDSLDKNVLEGLAGIYFGLRDFETSNKYKAEFERLKVE